MKTRAEIHKKAAKKLKNNRYSIAQYDDQLTDLFGTLENYKRKLTDTGEEIKQSTQHDVMELEKNYSTMKDRVNAYKDKNAENIDDASRPQFEEDWHRLSDSFDRARGDFN